MSQPVFKVPLKEINNYPQGRTGGQTMKKPGPAKGRKGHINPTKSGGINRPLKGQN